MHSDLQAVTVTATGAATSQRCRLKGIHYAGAAGGDANFVLTDGNGGTTRLDFAGLTDETEDVTIPENGILFKDGIYVSTLTNVASLTLFYDG